MPAAPGSDFTPFDALSLDTALGLKFASWSVDGEAVRGVCVVDVGLGLEVEFSCFGMACGRHLRRIFETSGPASSTIQFGHSG